MIQSFCILSNNGMLLKPHALAESIAENDSKNTRMIFNFFHSPCSKENWLS
jgi:hypothetical protein